MPAGQGRSCFACYMRPRSTATPTDPCMASIQAARPPGRVASAEPPNALATEWLLECVHAARRPAGRAAGSHGRRTEGMHRHYLTGSRLAAKQRSLAADLNVRMARSVQRHGRHTGACKGSNPTGMAVEITPQIQTSATQWSPGRPASSIRRCLQTPPVLAGGLPPAPVPAAALPSSSTPQKSNLLA